MLQTFWGWTKDASRQVVGEACTVELFERLDVLNVPCLRLAASRGLGAGIVGGAAVVKVPQIAKILASRSTDGLSAPAYLLETLALTITFAYNLRAAHAFLAYGETLFLAAQNVLILVLMGLYRGRGRGRQTQLSLLVLLYALLVAVLLTPAYVGPTALRSMQALTIPLGMASRLPQIWTIWRRKSAGQLSALTLALLWAGSVARVFTSLHETPNDRLLLAGFLLPAILNTAILAQVAYYWRAVPVPRRTRP